MKIPCLFDLNLLLAWVIFGDCLGNFDAFLWFVCHLFGYLSVCVCVSCFFFFFFQFVQPDLFTCVCCVHFCCSFSYATTSSCKIYIRFIR